MPPKAKRTTTTAALVNSTSKRQKLARPPSSSPEPIEDDDCYSSDEAYQSRKIPPSLRKALEKGSVYTDPTQSPDPNYVYVIMHENNEYYEGEYEKEICSVHKTLEHANMRSVEKWMREVGSEGDDELKADVVRGGRMGIVWKHEKGTRTVEVLKMKLE